MLKSKIIRNSTNFIFIFFFAVISCQKNKENKNDFFLEKKYNVYLDEASNAKISKKERVQYAQEGLEFLKNQTNDSLNRGILLKLARQFYILESDRGVKAALKELYNRSVEANDSINIAKTYNLLANQNINIAQNDSAYFYLLKAEKLFIKLNDSLGLGQNYIDKAFAQLYEGDYSGCELSCIQALGYYKNFQIRERQYDAYNLIGISSNELRNYDNAIIYHTKALNTARQYKLISKDHLEANSLNNIGVVYQNLDMHKKAIGTFKSALLNKALLKDSPALYSMILDNYAYSKLKLNDLDELPDLFFKSLKIREANGFESSVIINKIHLSEYYAIVNDTNNSQKFANQALQLAKTTKISGDLLVSLKQLSIVEHKNAAQYSKEYIKISDSIQQEERKAKDRFARIQFETDEIITEKDKLAEQNRSLLYFFIATMLIGLLLFIIRVQRAKNRELLLKEAQQKANEDIYNLIISQQASIEESRVKEKKRIAQELHDGVLGRLFGARLNLDSLNRFSDEDSIVSRFNYLAELKNIEQDIREISHDLNREKYVLINNFVAIVNNLLEEQQNSYATHVTSNINKEIRWEKLNNTIKINLYRIIQESLQNINKYAEARQIVVEIEKDRNNIILKIIDDGKGFETLTKKKGIGLQNMYERTHECNGTFDIKSNRGIGTTITISLPIQEETTSTL